MDQASIIGLTVQAILDNINTGKNMAKEYLSSNQVAIIQDSGLMENKTVKESYMKEMGSY